jgi:hypothetical protein
VPDATSRRISNRVHEVRLDRLGNRRKVSNSQVEVEIDKSLIRVFRAAAIVTLAQPLWRIVLKQTMSWRGWRRLWYLSEMDPRRGEFSLGFIGSSASEARDRRERST